MHCQHCRIHIEILKNVENGDEWVHVEPGNPPYRFCRFSVATPDTIGNWARRFLDLK